MDKKRALLAAGGISVLLVASSSAFAFASGIFVTRQVDGVGSFQAIQARLATETKPATTSANSDDSRPGASGSIPAPTAAVTATTEHEVRPTTTTAIAAIGKLPTVPATARSIERPEPPETEAATTVTSERHGPSTEQPKHEADDHVDEPHDGRDSDD